MEMRVNPEGLPPGVQDSKKANVSTQVLGILADLEKRLGYGTKENPVDDALVLKCDWAEFVREGENEVKVVRLEKIGRSVLEPLRPGLCLTLRTVAITAGLIDELLVTTAIASLQVTTERGSSANHEGSQNPSLVCRNAVVGQIRCCVLPKDIGHFEPMGSHYLPLASSFFVAASNRSVSLLVT